MEPIRINKYLSMSGVCSRRAADREIEEGNVRINGRIATAGDKVEDGMVVTFKGQTVTLEEEEIILAFNKPVGIVCTCANERVEKDNIIDYINYPKRIYPVGRLDKDSQGLILLTNQGDLVNKIMRAGNYHEKEYVVTVWTTITDEFLDNLRKGVYLEELDVTTRPCKVNKINDFTFTIILTQGYNRQIRRMCRAYGYHVKRLIRTRIMNIRLNNLEVGKYRELTPKEKEKLMDMVKDSYSAPKKGGYKKNGKKQNEKIK